MIGEIAAIVAGVNAATSAIKQVAETTNDIQSISGFLSALGGAEVELQRAQNEGKLSEADAVKAALAKKQIQETMREIKDLRWQRLASRNSLSWLGRRQLKRSFGKKLKNTPLLLVCFCFFCP